MRKFPLIILSSLILLTGCSINTGGSNTIAELSSTKVSLACWNAQTFFDAETEGTEYTEYKSAIKWSREKYLVRLERLCQVMTTLNPDIMVLEEIENASVVQDIANQLAGNSWSRKNNWNYGAFVRYKGSAIGCAVFSKYPLDNLKSHILDIRGQKENQPQVRPLLEVDVEIDGRTLTLFVNHWKSKSGGEQETEIWRDWQELVCQREISHLLSEKNDFACVVCGDFNRDASDFICNHNQDSKKNGNTIFRGAEGICRLFSPWFTSSGGYSKEIGSYYYQGKWERIDNIFVGGNVEISGFAPKTEGNWAEKGGIPNEYKLFSGEGYSDHLPLMCVLNLY